MKHLYTTILILVAFLAAASMAYGGDLECKATLSRAQEVTPPLGGGLTGGEIEVEFDAGLTQAEVELELDGDSANANRAHFHCGFPGENGPIVFGIVAPGPADCDPEDLADGDLECTVTNADSTGADCTATVGRTVGNIAALFFASREGLIYVNVHTVENGPGEVRGQLLCDAVDDDDDRKGRRRRGHRRGR